MWCVLYHERCMNHSTELATTSRATDTHHLLALRHNGIAHVDVVLGLDRVSSRRCHFPPTPPLNHVCVYQVRANCEIRRCFW